MTGQLTEPQSEQEPQQDTNRSGLTIEHTDDEGTTIDGTSRGDGTVPRARPPGATASGTATRAGERRRRPQKAPQRASGWAQQLRTAAAHAVRVRERLESDRADLAHWQAVRARQVADGTATDFGRHNVAAGDRVRVRDVWYPVVRANVKTVTVFGMFGPRTTPWQEVQAHQRAPQQAAQQAADGAQDGAGDGAGQ